MRGPLVGQLSLSLSIIAAVQLALLPASRAQNAPAPPQGEPEVQYDGNNGAPPPAPPPAAYPPPGQPGYPPQGPPPGYANGPFVTVNADNPRARLQTMGPLKWQDVCIAPCNRPVNPQGLYRIGGGSIRPSETFNMPRPSGRVVIDTQIGSTVKHWVGVVLIIAGVVDAGFGTLYYLSADTLATSSSNTTDLSKGYFQTVGIVGIVTGLVLLGVGIPLSMSSTSVEIR